MKRLGISVFLLLVCAFSFGQKDSSRWSLSASIGQYAARLAVPSFRPIHLGGTIGATYQWNKNQKNKFLQAVNLGYFYHANLQKATQLYTEVSYKLRLGKAWKITPLAIGGGYVLSKLTMDSFSWDPNAKKYNQVSPPLRNNWMLSLGAGFGYKTPVVIHNKPITVFVDYRIQVQGIIMKKNVPFIAYAPLMLGISTRL